MAVHYIIKGQTTLTQNKLHCIKLFGAGPTNPVYVGLNKKALNDLCGAPEDFLHLDKYNEENIKNLTFLSIDFDNIIKLIHLIF
jgi:hypothetical protein